jgi:hypothetical protein
MAIPFGDVRLRVMELIEAMEDGPLGVLYEGPESGCAIELFGRMSIPPLPPEGVVGEPPAIGEKITSPFSPGTCKR